MVSQIIYEAKNTRNSPSEVETYRSDIEFPSSVALLVRQKEFETSLYLIHFHISEIYMSLGKAKGEETYSRYRNGYNDRKERLRLREG